MRTYLITQTEHLTKTYYVLAESEDDAREQWEAGEAGEPVTSDCSLCEISDVVELESAMEHAQ